MTAPLLSPLQAERTDVAAALRLNGWTILHDVLPRVVIEALAGDLRPIFDRTPFCSGDFYGNHTKRFGSLLRRSGHAASLVQCPEILAAVEEVLSPWCDTIQLNLAQAIAIHPGAPVQFPHRDQDMWEGVKGEVEYLVNVMWPLVPFTAENGATLNREIRAAVANVSDRLHPFRLLESQVLDPMIGELDELEAAGSGLLQAIRRYHLRRMKVIPALLQRRDDSSAATRL